MRALLDHMLSRQFEVSTCGDGVSAMSLLSEGQLPDIILADMDAPRLNGAQLLESLQCSGAFRHIPVIILSGRTDEDSARALLGKGAAGVLVKPFNPDHLFEMVEQILGSE